MSFHPSGPPEKTPTQLRRSGLEIGQGIDNFYLFELEKIRVGRIDAADSMFAHQDQCADVKEKIADRMLDRRELVSEQFPVARAGGKDPESRALPEGFEKRERLVFCQRVAKNKLFEYWRSRKKEIEGDALESALIDAQIEQESIGRDAEWREHRLEALKHCMDQLDGTARDIVRMTYVDRLRSEQLAAVLKRKAAGVRVTLFRLREQLLHCIQRCLASEVTT